MSQPIDIGFRTYPAYRLFLIAIGCVIAAVLWFVIEHSLYGAGCAPRSTIPHGALRRHERQCPVHFGPSWSGCALAGLGGAVGAGILSLEPSYALKYVVLFLIVVIVGGEGSFKGSFVAAMALGIIDTLGKYFVTEAAAYLLYAAVFVLLLWRPQGLLPPKRQRDDAPSPTRSCGRDRARRAHRLRPALARRPCPAVGDRDRLLFFAERLPQLRHPDA